MKKLLALIMTALLVACSTSDISDESVQKAEPTENINLTAVCPYISGEIRPGPGGWYEEMHHTDGTTDIIFTDISTGMRKKLSDETTLDTPYGCVTGLFLRDGYLYHYSNGYPITMNKSDNVSALYQFSPDGQLLNSTEYPQDIKFTTFSAVVSDSENLYFAGNNITYNYEKPSSTKRCIYAVNQNDLSVKEIFRSDDCGITLIGGYKNRLILEVTETTDEGNFSRTVELMDITDFSREKLFETRYRWYMLDDKTLYNDYDEKGVLKTYCLDKKKAENITLFDSNSQLNNWNIPVSNIYDGQMFIRTSQYEGNYEKSYVYDYYSKKLTEVTHYYGLPYISELNGEKYCLITSGTKRVFLNNGISERADNIYAISSFENYIDSKDNIQYVKNEIDYR